MSKELSLTNEQSDSLRLLLKNKKYSHLIKQCDQYIKQLSSPDLLVYLLKGVALRESKLYDESHKLYLQALKLFPNNDDLLNDLSRLLIIKKDYKTAEAILKKIVSKNTNNQAAKHNLESLKILLSKQNKQRFLEEKSYEASRSLSPLRSAFNPSEIKESKENLKKVAKAKLDKKLNSLPELPEIDKEILAEEWISAGRDALRNKYPELTLQFCSFAVRNNGNTTQIYSLAADAYISIKQYVHAHLCYLIASEHGELDSSQQLNLLSLAAMIGDNTILTSRNKKLSIRTGDKSNSNKNIEKLMTSVRETSSTIFDPNKGIVNHKDVLNEGPLKKDDY